MAAEDKACILDMSSLGSLMLATLLAEIALKRQFDKGSRYRRFFRAFLLLEKKRKRGKQGKIMQSEKIS